MYFVCFYLQGLDRLYFSFSGKNFCISQIEELCANAVSVDSTQQIQDIIMFLQRSEGLSKHLDSFMQMLSLVQLKDVTEFVLSPLLSDELREEKFLRCQRILLLNIVIFTIYP